MVPKVDFIVSQLYLYINAAQKKLRKLMVSMLTCERD